MTGLAPAATEPGPLRRNRGFRLLWLGQVVSGTVLQAAMSLAVLAPLTSGLLVEHVSGQWAMAAFAAAMGAAAILSVTMPGFKNISGFNETSAKTQ